MVVSSQNTIGPGIFALALLLFIGLALNGYAQYIPASTTTGTGTCDDCVPPNWIDFGGTPDMSNATTAATSGTLGGGTPWTNGPLPLPPNGHQNWITIRDIGSAGAEESVGTNITGLTVGREYEVVAYTLSAIGGYSGQYIDELDFQIGTNPRVTISSINRDTDGEWGVSRFRFTADAASVEIAFYPGNDASGSEPPDFESVNLSVTLNAINTVPVAEDKNATTSAGTPVTVNVSAGAQDYDAGQDVVVSTIDLDPSTPGIQGNITTSDGSWVVNHTTGDVTFTPATSFGGMATIAYTIQDDFTLDGNPSPGTSTPKTITITSTTADIQINKQGPFSATPGSSISYNLYITNNGPGNAANVIVQDPAVTGFTVTGITCNAGDGTGASAACPVSLTVAGLQGTGLVIPSLPEGSGVLLEVTGTLSNTPGSFTNTATVTYGDDPEAFNNTSSVSTEILEAPCATSEYTLDPVASTTASQATFGADGGIITLVYTLTSGAPLDGIGTSFTMEVDYTDFDNPLTDNQWEDIVTVTTSANDNVALLPLTDGSGDLYSTPLPSLNVGSKSHFGVWGTDYFFTTHIKNGNLSPLGKFNITLPDYPIPSFAKIVSGEFWVYTAGNRQTTGADSETGFWLKALGETHIREDETSGTPTFVMQPGQTYVYRYSAFGDGTTLGYSNGGNRGLHFHSGNHVIFGYDDTPVISSITPLTQTVAAGGTPSAITVTASKANTATNPTYQWYSNTTNSNTGGTLIPGATSASYTPSTPSIGTDYYYVAVNGDGCATTVSNVVAVNVDLDSDNDGILDCDEKGLSGEIETAFAFVESGDAVKTGPFEAQLTANTQTQSGQLWSKGKVDFNESFTLSYEAYFGDHNGADGIATVFHNDPDGTNATGTSGQGIGAQGIQNGIVLELDTYSNTGEISGTHSQIWRSQNGAGLTSEVSLPNIEDDLWHEVIITWDATTQTISYTIDGLTAGIYTNANFVNNIFGGVSQVHFGYTASTGAITNDQRVRFPGGLCDLPLAMDTDGDGTPDYLDLDSDNDGCPDAVEGDGDIDRNQLNPDGSINSPEDANGIPVAANGGQGEGSAYDPRVNCMVITNPMLPSKAGTN